MESVDINDHMQYTDLLASFCMVYTKRDQYIGLHT